MSSLYRPESTLVSRKLLAARHEAGLTQAVVAQAWGKPQETVSSIERGARRIDIVELMDLCKILDLDVVQLISEVRDEAAAVKRKPREPMRARGKPRRRKP